METNRTGPISTWDAAGCRVRKCTDHYWAGKAARAFLDPLLSLGHGRTQSAASSAVDTMHLFLMDGDRYRSRVREMLVDVAIAIVADQMEPESSPLANGCVLLAAAEHELLNGDLDEAAHLENIATEQLGLAWNCADYRMTHEYPAGSPEYFEALR